MIDHTNSDCLDLLSPQEAADALGVTTRTIRKWAREGSIPCTRIGNGPCAHLRIPRGQLRNLITARTHGVETR